jgi:hypothetical protein
MSLKVTDLIKKNYIIEKVNIKNGRLALLTGGGPSRKLRILNTTETKDTTRLSVDLSNLNLSDTRVILYNLKSGLLIDANLENSSNKLHLEDRLTELRSESRIHLIRIENRKKLEIEGLDINVATRLQVNRDSVSIRSSDLDIDGLATTLRGLIDNNNKTIELELKTSGSDYNSLIPLLPEEIISKLSAYNPGGIFDADILIEGYLNKDRPLNISSVINLREGTINLTEQKLLINNIESNFDVKGNLRDIQKSLFIHSDRIDAMLNGNSTNSFVTMRRIISPEIEIGLSVNIPADEINRIAGLKSILLNDGSLRLNMRLAGTLDESSEMSIDKLLKLKRSVNIGLSSLGIVHPESGIEMESIFGNIMIADNVWIDDLSFKFLDQNIVLNGMLGNFNLWLLKESNNLTLTTGIWADRIDVSRILNMIPENKEKEKDRKTSLSLNSVVSSDSLIIGKLRSSFFSANISLTPDIINLGKFSLNTLGGEVSGNASAISLQGNRYATRGWFEVNNIDIREAFRVSNNFGQDHLTYENIDGTLYGSLSLASTLDSAYRPIKEDLVMNGSYKILNGRLIDFEPVYKLSRFIEIEELANISFSSLENDLIISNNVLTIPRMRIESSAFDITAEGNHSFAGNYDYHVKVLLSDILSRRESAENEKISEFGVIEDDGLGRTSVFLKVEGDRSGSSISHDMGALRSNIREDIEAEKQNLRSILNEEYGWYGNDTLEVLKQEETRKFRIVWEETDSIAPAEEVSPQKKLPLLKLFRKNKNKKSNTGGNWNH